MNIFVGNLSFDAREADVKKLFGGFGSVASVAIVMDKKGRESRGFGFVEMPDDEQALEAIAALNSQEFMGRPLNVEVGSPNPAGISLPIPLKEEPKSEAGRESRKRVGNNHRYKQGRRSLSFIKRRAAEGIVEPITKRKIHNNPMRWRKPPKPWQKTKNASKLSKSKT